MAYQYSAFSDAATAFAHNNNSSRKAYHACRSARQRRYYAAMWLENSVHVGEPGTLERARNARLRVLDFSWEMDGS